jgi:hypothetical protein
MVRYVNVLLNLIEAGSAPKPRHFQHLLHSDKLPNLVTKTEIKLFPETIQFRVR